MTRVDDKVCVGKITKAHGIKGHVCIHSYCQNPTDIFVYHPLTNATGTETFRLTLVGNVRGLFVANVNDIHNRNMAETLSNTELYIPKALLQDVQETDMFYVSDLIGVTVFSEDQSPLGQVIAVENFGAGDILDCQGADHQRFMVPFHQDAVLSVDLDANQIVISETALNFINDERGIE